MTTPDLPPVSPDEVPARFANARLLGEGAFGRVYGADAPDGRAIALKVMAPEAAARPEALWQFGSEYRKLARLGHAAFPAAVEEGRTPAGLPYYAMALVAGSSPAGPLPAAAVARIVVAAAEALGYLHGLGFVHGDIKPENLRLRPDGGLMMLDVGLMAPVGQRREAISGTLAYLAPEVLRKAPVDVTSDLYALGCVAYELWTGAPPFTGGPGALVRSHLQEPPPALAGRTPDGDAALEQLIMALLAKDPAARPASARAVLVALGAADADAQAGGPGLSGGRFIGREPVLAAWASALADQGPAWLVLVGEKGLGKSRALDECRLAAQVAGRAWVGAACVGAGDAPGSPVRSVVAQALNLAGLEPSPATAAWLAGTMSPLLLELEPNVRKAVLLAAAAADLAAAAAALGGLAVGLDDWHLADSASQDLIEQLRRLPPVAALAVALALDPGSIAPERLESWRSETRTLAPLTDAEAASLVAARLGGEPPDALVADLQAIAPGAPLLLDLLLEHLAASGRLRREGTGWRYDLGVAGAGAGLPGSLAELWRDRIAALDGPSRRLAEAAAVALPAGDLPPTLWASAARLTEEELPGALEALSRAGLVAEAAGLARLAAGGLPEVLVAGLAAPERAWMAASLVEALVGPAASASAEALAEVPLDRLTQAAWLAIAGGVTDGAGRLAAEAGRRALTRSAPREALRLLDAAAERLPASAPSAERLSVRLPRAEAERYLDQLAAAIPDYEEAVALAAGVADARAEAAALVALAKGRQMRGDYPGALAGYEAAEARAAAAGDGAQRARAAVSAARARLFQGSSAEALETCLRAAELAREAGAEAILSMALNLRAALEVQIDPSRVATALTLLDEALAISLRLGDRVGESLALESLGNTHLAVGDLPAAGEAFRRFHDVCRAIGTATEGIMANLNRAIVAAELGDTPAAVELAGDVGRRAVAAGRKFLLGAARAVDAQARWRAGRPDEALPLLDEALDLAEAIKNAMLEELVRALRLETWLVLGDRDKAEVEATLLDALVARTGHAENPRLDLPASRRTGHAEMVARLACHRAELARLGGDPAAAAAGAAAWVDDPNRVVAHRACQVHAAASLDLGQATDAAERAQGALAIARAWGAPWHEAADLVLLARARLQQGDRVQALRLAHEALDLGEGDGANVYARAAAALVLADAGEAVAARMEIARGVSALRARFAALGAEAWPAMLAAHGLRELELLARQVSMADVGTIGLAIAPTDFAACLEAIAQEADEAGIAQVALQAAMALTHAERGYMLAYERGRLRQAVTLGLSYEAEVEGGFSTTIAESVLYSGEPLYLPDAGADVRWQEAASVMALSLKTVICLPLAIPSKLLGVLYMDRQAIDPLLSEADLALLGALGTTAASAIFRERARRAEASAGQRAARCAELGAALAVTPPDRWRHVLLRAALVAAGAERAFWVTPDASGEWRGEPGLAASGAALPFAPGLISTGIAAFVAQQGKPVSLLDASAAEGWQDRQSVQALGLRTVWCLPTGLSDNSVVYLDAERAESGDAAAELAVVEALLAYALPLIRV